MRAHWTLLSALGAASALACSQPVVAVHVAVVTTACQGALAADPQRDPTAEVATLQFVLTGDGLARMPVSVPYANNSASIPNVPVGTNRRITVEALDSNGNVRSRADSGPFDVTAAGGDVDRTLFLRVVDGFVFTGANGSSACTHMNTPRAGHQMTLLPDGRVLITGGYNTIANGNGSVTLQYLTQAEIYDPADGTFSVVQSAEPSARAGHLAVPVTIGSTSSQVLLFGGEGPQGGGAIGPAGPFELFAQELFSQVGAPLVPRERAAMAVDTRTGYPVMAGGANGPDVAGAGLSTTIYDKVSYFDPHASKIVEVAEPLAQPLSDAVAVSRKNSSAGSNLGGVVLIGGAGMDGGASAQISGLLFSGSYQADTLYESPPLNALPAPRVHHSAVVASDDSIFVLGGSVMADDNYLQTTDAITVINPTQDFVGNAVESLSQQRADGCAVVMNSGEILYAGGAWGDSNGVRSTQTVDLITPSGLASTVRAPEGPTPGGKWSLQAARHKAACLLLADGTVLVTGGLQFQAASGTVTALNSAEIYTPPAP